MSSAFWYTKFIDIVIPDAKQAFHLYDKKGNGEVATKELASIFKALACHVDDEKLKDWADEMDEDGKLNVHGYTAMFPQFLKKRVQFL